MIAETTPIGREIADLGRDLRQGDTPAPQQLRDQTRLDAGERDAPPDPRGARGAAAATAHTPPANSGARPIQVPEPEQVRREGRGPAEPVWDAETTDRDSNPRYRTGGSAPSGGPDNPDDAG